MESNKGQKSVIMGTILDARKIVNKTKASTVNKIAIRCLCVLFPNSNQSAATKNLKAHKSVIMETPQDAETVE